MGVIQNTLMLGKTEGKKRMVWQRMRWSDNTIESIEHEFEQTQIVRVYK